MFLERQGIAYSLLGLWLVVLAIGRVITLSFALWKAAEQSQASAFWPEIAEALLVPILMVSAGVVLFFRGRGLALLYRRFLGPGRSAPALPDSEEIDPDRLQMIAISVLGLYFLIRGLNDLAGLGPTIPELRTLGIGNWSWNQAIGGLLQMLLGAGIFLRSRSVAVQWARFQGA